MNQHTRMRFARRMGESYPCPEYANPIEKYEGPGVLLSWSFWLGGIASLLVWTGIWAGIAWLLSA